MNAHVQLLFHANDLKFSLIRESSEWWKEFNTLREALQLAKKEGATELPFMMLGEVGELYTQSVVDVEPQNSGKISRPEELAAFLRTVLRTRDYCRVFSAVLTAVGQLWAENGNHLSFGSRGSTDGL
jgi:hypothetical protein